MQPICPAECRKWGESGQLYRVRDEIDETGVYVSKGDKDVGVALKKKQGTDRQHFSRTDQEVQQ